MATWREVRGGEVRSGARKLFCKIGTYIRKRLGSIRSSSLSSSLGERLGAGSWMIQTGARSNKRKIRSRVYTFSSFLRLPRFREPHNLRFHVTSRSCPDSLPPFSSHLRLFSVRNFRLSRSCMIMILIEIVKVGRSTFSWSTENSIPYVGRKRYNLRSTCRNI